MKNACSYVVSLVALVSSGAVHAGPPPKVDVCHLTGGTHTQLHTLRIAEPAVGAHVGHGDMVGLCDDVCDAVCFDGNYCTQSCDVATLTCDPSPPAVDCDDSDPDTVDTCEPALGCVHIPVPAPERTTSGANWTIQVDAVTSGNRLFGSGSGMLGDVNDDGVSELVVGARKTDPGGTSASYRPGVIYVYKSPNPLDGSRVSPNDAQTRVVGLGTDGSGGLGNFDTLPGRSELALTDAPNSHPLGGLGAILREFPDGDIVSSTIGDAATPSSTRITGATDVLFSSRPVLGFYDANGDPDLVLTHNIPNSSKTAQIWPGPLGAGQRTATAATERLELEGQAESTAATVVAELVDITGDGRDDLVLAPARDSIDYDYIDVVFGADTPLSGAVSYGDLQDGVVGVRIEGPAGTGFGASLSAAGDVDGDGFEDVLVSGRGAAWLLFGPVPSGAGTVPHTDLDPVQFSGITASTSYGNASFGVGDVDSDGFDDLLHCGSGEDSDAGACWLVFGQSRAAWSGPIAMADVVVDGGVAFANDDALAAWFGVSATGGDVDGDGTQDLVITAYPGVFVFAGPFR